MPLVGRRFDDGFNLASSLEGRKTDEVAKSAIQQTLYDARSDETRGACDQYPVVRADDEGIGHHLR